jgi:hypothetical protein
MPLYAICQSLSKLLQPVGFLLSSGHRRPQLFSNVKVKLSLCLSNQILHHEGVWGSGCIDPHSLDLSTNLRWVVSFTPLPLYPLVRDPGTHWIGGFVSPRAGLDVEKRKFLTLPGVKLQPLCRPAHSQLLYQLRYPSLQSSINSNRK